MKKLIPAICMLLVAATLLGTSTFAWFSMNQNVTATGMSVTAVSSGGLAIATYTSAGNAPVDSAFANTAAAEYKASATVAPTSTLDGATWYSGAAAKVDNYAVDANKYNAVSTGLDGYRLESKFQIKSLATDGTTSAVYVSGVTVTTEGTTNLNKALRVAIKYGATGNVAFFAPVYTAKPTSGGNWKCVTSASATTDYPNLTFGSGAYVGSDSKGVSIGTASATASDVTIWVYFDGEDENCRSIEAVDLKALTVSVGFTSNQPGGAS